jgi:hypothetical protein
MCSPAVRQVVPRCFDIVSRQGLRSEVTAHPQDFASPLLVTMGGRHGLPEKCKLMTKTTSFILVIGNTVRVAIRTSARGKQPRKLPSLTTMLFLFVAVTTVIALGIAALAGDATWFANVKSVWLEIKPLLLGMMEVLRKQ